MKAFDPFINACIKANQKIYEYITTHISETDYNYSNTIGVGGDNSLNIDLICEKIFIDHLKAYGNIYTEEAGFIVGDVGEYKIIIDPLDGSNNFKAQLPYYGTSVALEKENKTIASVVCNLANHKLLYKVDKEEPLEIDLITKKALVSQHQVVTNLAIFEKAYDYPTITQKLYDNQIKFRSPGAVALSIANARNYGFVLFAGNIREFDIKAALHICDDLNIYFDEKFLIVSKNIDLFNKIKEIIKE